MPVARAAPLQTALNAGELSELMEGRSTDFAKYQHALRRGRNILLGTTGYAAARPGSRYRHALKSSAVKGRLWPFVASPDIDNTECYMLEWGDGNLRFIKYMDQLDAADVTSSITNGTFTSNINDWDDLSASPAAISHDASNGRLSLDPSGDDFAHAEQDVTTSNTGTEHILRFKSEGTLGATVKVQIGSSSGDNDVLDTIELGLGYHVVAFTPDASPYYLQFINEMVNDESVYIDDVEILDNVPVELVSPYAEADLYEMRFTQSNDVLYITMADRSKRPWQLERRADKTWSLVQTYFEDGPYGGINPGRKLSEDNLIPDGYFEQGIKGWLGQGNTQVEHDGTGNQLVIGSSGANPEARYNAVTTDAPSQEHVIHIQLTGESGDATDKRIGLKIGATAGASGYLNQTDLVAGWYSYSFTPGTAFHVSVDKSNDNSIANGVAAFLVYNVNHHLLEVDGTSGSVTLTAKGNFAPFTSVDVGRLIRLEWPGYDAGWGVITAFTDSQTVTVQTRRDFAYANVPTESWRLGLWSDRVYSNGDLGWPKASALYESRSVWDGGRGAPLTVVLSQSADLLNMRPDTFESAILTIQDDDALTYTLAANEISDIEWIIGDNFLIIGTAGGQWVMRSDGITITATDRDAKKQTNIKSADLQPIAIGDTGVYVEAGMRRVYDIGYAVEADQLVAADLTVLSQHMFRRDRSCGQPAFQQRPYKNIWFPRSDGKAAVLKYDRNENIVGWTLQTMAGAFGSGDAVVDCIAVKPGSDDSSNNQEINSGERDEVWMIVKRTIDGNTVRYVEVLEGDFEGALRRDYAAESTWAAQMVSDQEDAFHLDCGITVNQASSTTVSGLDHLEGQSVMALVNGVVQGPFTVSSGSITLTSAGTKIQVGLARSWEMETTGYPFGLRIGSPLGNPQQYVESSILFHHSGGDITVQASQYDEFGWRLASGDDINWNHPQSSSKTPLWSGFKKVELQGSWGDDCGLYLSGSDPLPVVVTAISPEKLASSRKGGQ